MSALLLPMISLIHCTLLLEISSLIHLEIQVLVMWPTVDVYNLV